MFACRHTASVCAKRPNVICATLIDTDNSRAFAISDKLFVKVAISNTGRNEFVVIEDARTASAISAFAATSATIEFTNDGLKVAYCAWNSVLKLASINTVIVVVCGSRLAHVWPCKVSPRLWP